MACNGSKDTTHALHLSDWLYIHLFSSGNQTAQDFEHLYSNSATQRSFHRHYAESTSYRGSFHVYYSIHFVVAHITDLVIDHMRSTYLAASRRSIYIHYNTVGKIKHQGLAPLFVKLNRNPSAANTLTIMYLDVPGFYISSQEYILFVIQAADASVRNDHHPATFYANSAYIHTINLTYELHVRQFKHVEKYFLIYVLFLNSNSQKTKIFSYSIMCLFICIMCRLD